MAMPRLGPLQRLLQGCQLLLPAHKTGEPLCCAGLQTPPNSASPDQLKHLHGFCQPLDWKPPQRVDLHQAFGQSEGRYRQPNRRTEDGVGMREAVREYLSCTWLPKESRKSWGHMTQRAF